MDKHTYFWLIYLGLVLGVNEDDLRHTKIPSVCIAMYHGYPHVMASLNI